MGNDGSALKQARQESYKAFEKLASDFNSGQPTMSYKKKPPDMALSDGGKVGLVNASTSGNHTTDGTKSQVKSIIVNANDVKSAPVPWLIPNFISRCVLNSIQGLPGGGKTNFTLSLVAAIARGGSFPNDAGEMVNVPRGRVLYANFDDVYEHVGKPRLEKMGLTENDFNNITFVNSDSGLTFNDPRLAEVFEEVKPDLAVFDTLQHFIGASVDLHRANETNASLIGLKNLCEKYNTAAVIVQHISKQAGNGNGGASVMWGLGSTAINGLFRSVWTIGKLNRENDSPYRRALIPSKTSLSPVNPPARLFDLDPQHGFMSNHGNSKG